MQTLIYLTLLAFILIGCDKKNHTEHFIRPSFSGTHKQGNFILISETLSDTGMRLTPGVGGEKIYVKIVKARIIAPAEFAEIEFSIRKVKTEDENWHSLFQSGVGTIYSFSNMNQRLQSSHGGPTFEIEDFINLEEMIQPVDPANASNAASVDLNQSARIR